MSDKDLRLDTYTIQNIVYDGDAKEFKLKRRTITKKFDPILRLWEKIDEKEEWLPLNARKPSLEKRLKFSAILRRSFTDRQTLEPINDYYLIGFTAEVPQTRQHRYVYLSECEGHILLHDLKWQTTQFLGLNDENFIRVGKPRKISEERARQLMKEGKVYPNLLVRVGNQYRILIQ